LYHILYAFHGYLKIVFRGRGGERG
jgi:hypothetical protein